VYGYRVDNVHNETYRMWNGMVRNAAIDDGIPEDDEEDESSQVDADGNPINQEEAAKKRQKRNYLYRADKGGERTLESNLKNITLESFDTQHEKDPLFKKTTQKFDEMRIGNLMSSTLSTTPSLLLQLDSKMVY
jgi:superfamily I DNA and/or RNA helicase